MPCTGPLHSPLIAHYVYNFCLLSDSNGKVAFEQIPMLAVCRPACHGASLHLFGWSRLSSFLVVWPAGGRHWGSWCALPKTTSFFSQCWLYPWLLSSPWPTCWSFYPCMWCWAYFFPFWPVHVCSVLVWSVSRSLHHVIAGSMQELYTCLFRQMARLLLKRSRCLAEFSFFLTHKYGINSMIVTKIMAYLRHNP